MTEDIYINHSIDVFSATVIALALASAFVFSVIPKLRKLKAYAFILSLHLLTATSTVYLEWGYLPEVSQWVATIWWLSLAYCINRALYYFVWNGALRRGEESLAPKILIFTFTIVIYLSAGLAIAHLVYDKPITAFLTTSGLLVVVLGYSAKSTLEEVFAGIALSLSPSFAKGDVVEIDNQFAQVEEMNWRAVTLRSNLGNIIVVPNTHFSTHNIVNHFTNQHSRRAEMEICLTYGTTVNQAITLIREAILEVHGLTDPRINVKEFYPAGIKYRVRFAFQGLSIPMVRHLAQSAIYYKVRKHPIADFATDPWVEKFVWKSETKVDPARARELISQNPVFSVLTPAEVEQLSSACTALAFGPPETIIQQGDIGDSLYIIDQGSVDVRLEKGKDWISVATLKSGQYFGEMALLTGETRSATVKAQSDVVVYEIQKSALQPILLQRPELAEQMATVVIEHWNEDEALIESYENAKKRQSDAKHGFLDTVVDNIRSFFSLPPTDTK